MDGTDIHYDNWFCDWAIEWLEFRCPDKIKKLMSPQSSSKPSGDSLSECSSLCINQGYAKQEISEPDTITPVGSHIARNITRKYRDGFSCIFAIMNAVWAICNRFPICSKVESMSSLCQYQANKQFLQIQRSKHIVLAAIWISRTIIRTTLIRLHVPLRATITLTLIRSKVKSTYPRESVMHIFNMRCWDESDTEDLATCEDEGGVQNRDSLFSQRFMWSRAHLPSLTRHVQCSGGSFNRSSVHADRKVGHQVGIHGQTRNDCIFCMWNVNSISNTITISRAYD